MSDRASDFTAVRGCLCGQVRYGRERLPSAGMCHCSTCCKVPFVGSNAVLAAHKGRFGWLAGGDGVRTFALPSGWSTAVCVCCGLPVPQPTPDGERMWAPAGSLDGDPLLGLSGHIDVAPKPGWCVIGDHAPQYDEAP